MMPIEISEGVAKSIARQVDEHDTNHEHNISVLKDMINDPECKNDFIFIKHKTHSFGLTSPHAFIVTILIKVTLDDIDIEDLESEGTKELKKDIENARGCIASPYRCVALPIKYWHDIDCIEKEDYNAPINDDAVLQWWNIHVGESMVQTCLDNNIKPVNLGEM